MKHTYSQLLGTRLMAKEVHSNLINLWVHLCECNLITDTIDTFEDTDLRLEDVGSLCDDIIQYCNHELMELDIATGKKRDKRKEYLKKEKEDPSHQRTSRWW
jgi:hypothetical protein